MSLLPCLSCGHQCSDLAHSCPNCGHPSPGFRVKIPTEQQVEKAKKRRKVVKRLLIATVILVPILAMIAEYYKSHPFCPIHKVRMTEVSSSPRIGNERIVEYECPGPPAHTWTTVRKE
jgi:uncharacterized membrane protein YvbJ